MNDTLDPARRAAQVTRAAAFAGLHTPASPLALANAWDVAGARLVEAAGGAAVATTSAGVAWSLGAPDGDALARDRALDLVSRVAAAVSVPVTADIEGGFGADPAGVAETVAGVLAAGAVGINIEDGDRAPADHAERLAAPAPPPRRRGSRSTSTPAWTRTSSASGSRAAASTRP